MEPLGIALELAAKRKALAARMSPQARRMAFPAEHAREAEWRRAARRRIAAGQITEWSEYGRTTIYDAAQEALPRAAGIIEICAKHWRVPAAMIYDPEKRPVYVIPRHAVMKLLRELMGLSQPISGVILNRHHTSVLHGLRLHRRRYENDADYRARFDAAREEARLFLSTDQQRAA